MNERKNEHKDVTRPQGFYSNKESYPCAIISLNHSIDASLNSPLSQLNVNNYNKNLYAEYFEYSNKHPAKNLFPRAQRCARKKKKKKMRCPRVEEERKGGRADRNKNAIKIVGKRPRRACSPDSKDPEDETIPPRRIQCSHVDSFACIYSWTVCA